MNNLHLYHKMLHQLCQWFPQERITRKRNMAWLLVGLYASGRVHLSHIVRKWPLPGKELSLVNRLRRFLSNPRWSAQEWYRPVVARMLAPFAGQPLRLVIDCTTLGLRYRLMVVGLAYRRRTLPLAWSIHRGIKGHTTTQEQIALFARVEKLLPRQSEVWVMGDTGFQSVNLLCWLRRRGWHFVIRQRGFVNVRWAGQEWVKLNTLQLAPGQTRVIGWVRMTQVYDVGWFWLLLHWQKGQEEPWYLVSDRPGRRQHIQRYKIRMWIEEMFGDMKGHGFDLEATHLDDLLRLSRLVFALCFAFSWLIALGSWVVKNGYRHFIDHKSRRDKSCFRLGWDWVARCIRLGLPVPIRFSPYL
jgi:hypothetical protein